MVCQDGWIDDRIDYQSSFILSRQGLLLKIQTSAPMRSYTQNKDEHIVCSVCVLCPVAYHFTKQFADSLLFRDEAASHPYDKICVSCL